MGTVEAGQVNGTDRGKEVNAGQERAPGRGSEVTATEDKVRVDEKRIGSYGFGEWSR